jgi:transcriptional regulator with XRE-family HTH domain
MAPVDWDEIVHREPDLELAAKIRRMRLARHWSQSDLAGTAGVSVGTVQRAERGKFYPSRRTLEAFAYAFMVEPAVMGLGPKPERTPEPVDPSLEVFTREQERGKTLGRRIAAANWNEAYARHQRESRAAAGLGPGPGEVHIWHDQSGQLHIEQGPLVYGSMGPNSFGAFLRRRHG